MTKKWLLTLKELSTWEKANPSAPELARALNPNRDRSAVYRELQMMRASGYVRVVSPDRPDTHGLQRRWQITERGLDKLRRAGEL